MFFFTDCLLLLRCLLLGFRCAAGAKDRHGFFAGGKYDEVVCHMTGLDMRSDGHVPKGQKFIAQRQAKRRPGYNVAVQVAPCKGKSAEIQSVMFTFALTGRGVMWRFTQGVASLALGYGGHWAFSPLGYLCHTAVMSETKLSIRCESRMRLKL